MQMFLTCDISECVSKLIPVRADLSIEIDIESFDDVQISFCFIALGAREEGTFCANFHVPAVELACRCEKAPLKERGRRGRSLSEAWSIDVISCRF